MVLTEHLLTKTLNVKGKLKFNLVKLTATGISLVFSYADMDILIGYGKVTLLIP